MFPAGAVAWLIFLGLWLFSHGAAENWNDSEQGHAKD
jgi:hypothetical protein